MCPIMSAHATCRSEAQPVRPPEKHARLGNEESLWGFFFTTEVSVNGNVPPAILCLVDIKRYLYMQIFLGHLAGI